MLNYGHQLIEDDDIAAVVKALRSDYLTTGPRVEEFERIFADYVGAKYAVAVSTGTAALHCAMHAVAIPLGSSVIVPPITFIATTNAALSVGATVLFADVDPAGLLDPRAVRQIMGSSNISAVITVDYAGQPSHYAQLREICKAQNIPLIADACHSLGTSLAGSSADITCFSFHPVKAITTGEGGMLTTDILECARRARIFRNHGRVDGDMRTLGANYRLSDIACALGVSQLAKLDDWIAKRNHIAKYYDGKFSQLRFARPLRKCPHQPEDDAYHLYVLRSPQRLAFRGGLELRGIGTTVHYPCVYEHTYYRWMKPIACPNADAVSREVFSIPLYPAMTNDEVEQVIEAVLEVDANLGRVQWSKLRCVLSTGASCRS